MNVLDKIHDNYVYGRRVRTLTELLARMIPDGSRVLDVGGGDGLIASLIQERKPTCRLECVDVLEREHSHMPVKLFDGRQLPYDDESMDVVMFVDVLHHTDDPTVLLREAARVSRGGILIKDHTRDGFLAGPTLRFMDYVGNARHGVRLPYNYWPRRRWQEAIAELGCEVREWLADLKLYPWAVDRLFGRSLHFIAYLERASVGKAHETPASQGR